MFSVLQGDTKGKKSIILFKITKVTLSLLLFLSLRWGIGHVKSQVHPPLTEWKGPSVGGDSDWGSCFRGPRTAETVFPELGCWALRWLAGPFRTELSLGPRTESLARSRPAGSAAAAPAWPLTTPSAGLSQQGRARPELAGHRWPDQTPALRASPHLLPASSQCPRDAAGSERGQGSSPLRAPGCCRSETSACCDGSLSPTGRPEVSRRRNPVWCDSFPRIPARCWNVAAAEQLLPEEWMSEWAKEPVTL